MWWLCGSVWLCGGRRRLQPDERKRILSLGAALVSIEVPAAGAGKKNANSSSSSSSSSGGGGASSGMVVRYKGEVYEVAWATGRAPAGPATDLVVLSAEQYVGGLVQLSDGCAFANPRAPPHHTSRSVDRFTIPGPSFSTE